MKKTILLAFTAFGLCSAQTTITKAFNDPLIGETVNNVIINGTVDNSAAGSNVVFSNPSLTQGASSLTAYSAPDAGEITTYPGSTIKMTGGGNTILFKQTASKLEITGLITPDATLNFAANNGTYISYPAAFGYSETDTAQGTFTSSAASGNFSGTINISADASGTLLLGSGTYTNVVRIKSVQTFNLTVGPFPAGTITNTSYLYYNTSNKAPLLSYTSANINVPALNINQTTTAAQALNTTFLATGETVKKEMFKMYPNPAQDFIGFTGAVKNFSTARIYSLDGKLIQTSDIQSGKIQISELPAAAYFIEISGKDTQKKETAKFIKK